MSEGGISWTGVMVGADGAHRLASRRLSPPALHHRRNYAEPDAGHDQQWAGSPTT
jgi:hypothetical protein